jgi:hypothetical protein
MNTPEFGCWLFPPHASSFAATSKGVAILIVLFALEVAALWQTPALVKNPNDSNPKPMKAQ